MVPWYQGSYFYMFNAIASTNHTSPFLFENRKPKQPKYASKRRARLSSRLTPTSSLLVVKDLQGRERAEEADVVAEKVVDEVLVSLAVPLVPLSPRLSTSTTPRLSPLLPKLLPSKYRHFSLVKPTPTSSLSPPDPHPLSFTYHSCNKGDPFPRICVPPFFLR